MTTAKQEKTPNIWLPVILVGAFTTMMSLGTIFYLQKSLEQTGDGKVVPAVVVETPHYVDIKPFTINIQSDDKRQRLLYSGVTIKVANEQTNRFLSDRKTEIRSRLIQMLSEAKAEVIVTPEGKAALTAQIMGIFDKPFAVNQPELNLTEILFTDFIVQ